MIDPRWAAARRVLAVRLDNIGDVIMLGPALRAVRAGLPAATLTLLASPAGATAAPLLPWIDDVLAWRPVWQDVGHRLPFAPAREWTLIRALAERRFDAALLFTSFSQTPHVPGYVCYLAGIPLRAGESKEFGGSTLTTALPPAPDALHQVERNLRLVEALGFPVADRRLRVTIPPEGWREAAALLRSLGLRERGYVLLHPGASAAARRYPTPACGEVARLLVARGWPVLVTATEREAALAAAVVARAPGALPLVGQTRLAAFAALIARAAVVICGNTLPLHLADALGVPVVALYSGTDYEAQWRPRTVPHRLLRRPTACYPCYRFDCPIGQPCLAVPPAAVVAAVEELAASSRADRSLAEPAAVGGDR